MRSDVNKKHYASVEDYVRENPCSLGSQNLLTHVPGLREMLQEYETPGIKSRELLDDLPMQNIDPLFSADPAERKAAPVASGVLDYFPSALIEIAKVSKAGNDQHNPGEPLHWARGKSMDQSDCIIRHFMERGTFDADGLRHSAKLAWRALALLQEEMEKAGAPLARGATEE